jgi:hypothetical protein
MQVPRIHSTKAIELITACDPAPAKKDALLAKAQLTRGYSIQILWEKFCNVTFNSGPLMARAQGYARAAAAFTAAISLASGEPDILAAAYKSVGRGLN